MLDLDPGRIKYGQRPETPELHIRAGFDLIMRDTASNLLITQNMDADGLITALCECIRTGGAAAIAAAIRGEEWYRQHFADSPCVVKEMTTGTVLDDQCIPQRFLESIYEDVRRAREEIQSLLNVVQDPELSKIMELIREVSVLMKSVRETKIDPIFNRIRECEGNEEYTLPFGSIHKLVFLPYLEMDVRFAVQSCLLFHSLLTGVERDNQNVLRRYLRASVFEDRHWGELAQKYGSSDAVSLQLIQAQIELQHAIQAIQNSRLPEEEKRKHLAYTERWDGITQRMRRHAPHLPRFLEQMDLDHCIDLVLTRFELQHALNNELPHCEKDGRSALIYEDHSAQMDVYVHHLRDHSPLTLLPEKRSLCTRSDQVIYAIDTAAYFLLDIQNEEEGPNAGINLAERIIKHHWEKRSRNDAGMNVQPITIVVWSTSQEHVKRAETELWQTACALDPRHEHITIGSYRAKENWLQIETRSKYSQLYFQ